MSIQDAKVFSLEDVCAVLDNAQMRLVPFGMYPDMKPLIYQWFKNRLAGGSFSSITEYPSIVLDLDKGEGKEENDDREEPSCQ